MSRPPIARKPRASSQSRIAGILALLEALTADIHGAFRACLQEPIEHDQLRDWRDLSRLVEQRMLAIYADDAAARQLILAQHGLAEVTHADRQHDIELGQLMQQLFDAYLGLYLPPHLPKRNL